MLKLIDIQWPQLYFSVALNFVALNNMGSIKCKRYHQLILYKFKMLE